MKNKATAHELPDNPIILKDLMLECGIRQADIAGVVRLARPTLNLTLNRGYLPDDRRGELKRGPSFQERIEKFIQSTPRTMQWLFQRGLRIEDVWKPNDGEQRGRVRDAKPKPVGFMDGAWERRRMSVIQPGDPEALIIKWEVEMITQEAMKHFKVFRNPFIDDIQKDADIYMSDEHRYIESAMVDAARHGGFLAVIGEVGSGKSVMRRKVVEQLRKDGDILIIYPQIIDKTRLNAASICDAIIMDISSDKPRIKLEMKTRQVQQLLLERSKQNYRSVLIIEEAHDLNINTLKYLKRFYELEDGYKKLLGIILIGQTELKHAFNEAQHVDLREVIRRVQIAEIQGLNGHIKEYLNLKFKRVGAEMDKIFAPDAVEALGKRLTSVDRQNKRISHAYPLLVNNYAAKSMNMAYEMGEAKVTEAVVMAI